MFEDIDGYCVKESFSATEIHNMGIWDMFGSNTGNSRARKTRIINFMKLYINISSCQEKQFIRLYEAIPKISCSIFSRSSI